MATKTKRAGNTIVRLFSFFEENGLIATRMEGRERIAELLTDTQDTRLSVERTLTLADLDSAYESYLRSHNLTFSQDKSLKLLDPFTGQVFLGEREKVQFKIDFNPVKITEPRDIRVKEKRKSSKPLEEFEDAAKS